MAIFVIYSHPVDFNFYHFIIFFLFLNAAWACVLRRLRLAGSRSEMMQSAAVPAEGAVKGLPEMLGVPMQRKTPPFLADLIW